MSDIELHDLTLTRGDTGYFKFPRKDKQGNKILTPPSQMYFTIKDNWSATTAIVQKTLEDMTFSEDYWHIVLEPDDTEALAVKDYVYDIEVTDGYVKTIAKGAFHLTKEATWYTNKSN